MRPLEARRNFAISSHERAMGIELVTFGGLHILDDDGELDWLAGQRSRAALLVYLAVERRVSRDALTTVFWPESDTENARHALRQALYQVKKALSGDWVESLSHDLVVTDDVLVDVHAFTDAVSNRDLETAVRLYRGPFLDGVHLADLSSWESWVDSKRAQLARTHRKACRDLIESMRSAGDMSGAIRVAEHWSARDRLDDEAQHRLIETLAAAGERAEALRQYETYARMLEAEGLAPADETRVLAERLRAEPSVLPVMSVIPAPPPPAGITKRINKPWLGAVVAIVMLLIAGFVWKASRMTSDGANGLPNRIAVLPFAVHGGQSASYLREGMVNLLAAAFDGAGSLQPVDARAVFAASEMEANPQRIAAHLDADMYLLGDVTEGGGKLQIDASVFRRGAPEPLVRATVSGAHDSVFVLADMLAARLLADLYEPGNNRLVRAASLTTASLPAFKDYLEGDRLMRSGKFELAAESYLAAIRHDSAFAVAYYRLALAREWAPLPGEDSAAAAAAHYAARLSSRDQNLLEAFRLWRSGRASEAESAYRRILTRYPDDVDAWFQLAEILFHHAPLRGSAIAASSEAWRRVLAYEPGNLFAITHLARIGVIDNRLQLVDSLLSRFSDAELRTDRRLAELALLRAVARDDTGTVKAMTATIRQWEPLAVWRVSVFITAFNPRPDRVRDIVRDLVDSKASPSLRADMLWFGMLLDLAAGSIDQAHGIEDALRPGFGAVSEWSVATLPLEYSDSTLMRFLRNARNWKTGLNSASAVRSRETGLGAPLQLEAARQYTLGMLAIRLRDTTSARAASTMLTMLAKTSKASVLTRDLDRGLRARLAWQHQKSGEALALLDSLELNDIQGEIAATPFVSRANERFLRAEILAASGRDSEALKWFESIGYGSVNEVPLRVLSVKRQAAIRRRN